MSESSGVLKPISVAEAASMSLDEYIAAAGIKTKIRNQKQKNKKKQAVNKDIESMDCDDIPSANSVSWRLKDVNRPIGMAPLIPTNAKYRNIDMPYADRDKPISNGMNRSYEVNGVNRQNRVNRKNQPAFKNNIRQNVIMQTGIRNAMNSNALVRKNNAIATINEISSSVADLVAPLIAPSSYEKVFNKLLEKWEAKKNENKQKYDMVIQKDISEIQGKTLYFSSSSGTDTVLSSDGDGLVDLQVRPEATERSLHQRFK